MQEVYPSAFRNLAAFRVEASPATWLTRIVVNEAVDRIRPWQGARRSFER